MTRLPTLPLTDAVKTPFVRPGLLSWVVAPNRVGVPQDKEPTGVETVTARTAGLDIDAHGREGSPQNSRRQHQNNA